jgi:hypothetical protein
VHGHHNHDGCPIKPAAFFMLLLHVQAMELRNKASEVLQKMQGLLESLVGWVMRTSGRVSRIQELIARAGPRPSGASIATPEGAEALSWWAVSFLCMELS